MFDCSSDVRAFHNEEVTLPLSEQKAMRERRDANRRRLKKGLKKKRPPLAQGIQETGIVRNAHDGAGSRQRLRH